MRGTIAHRVIYGAAVSTEQRSRLPIVIAACGVLAFGAVVTAILIFSHGPAADTGPDVVHIEVRSRTKAPVMIGGRMVGRAPLLVAVPRSYTPTEIDVQVGVEHWRQTITPDHDQVVTLLNRPR